MNCSIAKLDLDDLLPCGFPKTKYEETSWKLDFKKQKVYDAIGNEFDVIECDINTKENRLYLLVETPLMNISFVINDFHKNNSNKQNPQTQKEG